MEWRYLMAENKKSFVLYSDLIHTVKKMPVEKQAKLFTTILEYVNDLEPDVSDDLILDLVFEPIKQQLKRDLKKWENKADQSRENGKKGGRPKKTQENPRKPIGFFENLDEPKKPVNVNVNVNDSVNVNDNDKPTLITESKLELRNALADYFCVTELSNHFNYRLITNFCKQTSFTLDDFKCYKKYKEISGEKSHGIKNFIGSQEENFFNGAWGECNWSKKLLDYTNQNKSETKQVYKSPKFI